MKVIEKQYPLLVFLFYETEYRFPVHLRCGKSTSSLPQNVRFQKTKNVIKMFSHFFPAGYRPPFQPKT